MEIFVKKLNELDVNADEKTLIFFEAQDAVTIDDVPVKIKQEILRTTERMLRQEKQMLREQRAKITAQIESIDAKLSLL